MAKIGFIGLGTMGGPMALNIVKGGHEVRGFDIDKNAIEKHVENGGLGSIAASETALNAEIVFTMLPNYQHVNDALFDEDGAVKNMNKGTIVIDMSTIHPFESDKIRNKLNLKGISMIDCPIGRTSVEAIQGKSLLMVGAEENDLNKVTPILNLIGDTIQNCGGPGMGSRMKIVNNYMTTVLNVLSAETLTLAKSVGLNQGKCLEVLSGTAAVRSHLTTTYPAKVLNNDISPAFMVDLAYKDLGIALELGKETKVPLDLGKASKIAYEAAKSEGRGKQDWTSIFLSMQSRSGLKLPDKIVE